MLISKSKVAAEDIPITFNFGTDLAVGESISGQTVTASVFSGIDATPSSIISGIPTVSGSKVTQILTAGVLGVIYNVICTVTTSASHVFTRETRIAVITPGGMFGQES